MKDPAGPRLTPRDPAAAPPTLDDVAALTADSDFSAYTALGVDPLVRNAALKKLFLSDPRFNATDGLDVCADAACESDSSPQARQRQILRARALGLLDDDLAEQDEPPPAPGPER